MEEIINSIMHNPENTNPNVLRDQLQGISSGIGIVIVDEEELEDDIFQLNIKAEELYKLSKNNIVFRRQVFSHPDSNFESFVMLHSYSYELIQLETGSEMGYRFGFQNDTYMGTADDYPYYKFSVQPGNPSA